MIDSLYLIILVASFLAALLLVIKSSGFFVSSAIVFSRHYHIPLIIVGLLVVSVGTSLPELFTSTAGSLFHYSGISIGTVMGANMVNISLLLGIAILMLPRHHKSRSWVLQGFILIAVTLLFVTVLFDGLYRYQGMLLLILFAIYVYGMFYFHRAAPIAVESALPKGAFLRRHPAIVLVLSAVALAGGAVWLVMTISSISEVLGIANSVIAALVVALGTTLPELTVMLHSLRHKAFDVMLGNLVGSNIVNTLLVVGVASVVRPFAPPEPQVLFMIPFFVFAPLLVMIYLTRTVPRLYGAALIILYAIFFLLTVSVSPLVS